MIIKMWCYVILVATIITLGSGQEVCLSANRNPYLLFGTKTSYTFANQGIPATRVHDVVGCQPKAIWLLSRHGSNNPEANEISDLQSLVHLKKNIQENYRNGNFRNTNQRICEADLQLLDRWDWNPRINATFAGDLTSDGYLTTQQLADAWRKRFPGLLTDNRHDYLFKFADDKRSTTFFHAFLEGLFRDQAELRGYDIPKENDAKLLKPFENCPSWISKVQNNNETYTQLGIFEGKREYQEMIHNVSQRLGFNYDIDKDTLKRMYNMCRYNKAWDVVQISPWCSVFDQEDLKRLEYAEDLESYYKYGYGSQINQNVGCPLVRDMMNFFKKHIENEVPQQPRSSVLLGEASSLLAAVTSLRGRRDAAPLTGDNYHTSAQRARRWTTSTLVPFNANLAAILYTCTPNGNFQIKDKHQVLFLENEQPMYLEGCRVGLCEWSYVVEHYGEFANKCDTNVCNGATSNMYVATTLAILAFLITVFV